MKDFYVNKKYILIAIVYLGFVLFVPDNVAPSFIFALAISYGIVTRSCFNDDQDRGGIFLRTLPIKASTIVISKYVLGITILLINMAIFTLLSLVRSHDFDMPYENISILILTLSFAYSVYLPVFFRYGYMKATTFQTMFFVGIMLLSFGLSSLRNIVKLLYPNDLSCFTNILPNNGTTLMILSCFIAIIMLIISAVISLKFYNYQNA